VVVADKGDRPAASGPLLRRDGKENLRRWRRRDIHWRLGLLKDDLKFASLGLMIAAILAVIAYSPRTGMGFLDILQWAATAVAAFTRARKHRLLSGERAAPPPARRVARRRQGRAADQRPDERADGALRFLIESSGTPVAILIDNLDRCRGDYVVELLEGIQTLLRDETRDTTDDPMVVYLVAADRRWLCDSYLTVYDEFKELCGSPAARSARPSSTRCSTSRCGSPRSPPRPPSPPSRRNSTTSRSRPTAS
jgi:hypothetical protein